MTLRTLFAIVLVAALGIQTYRLQGANDAVKLLENQKTERERRDAMRVTQALKNKERTDEEDAAARKRAAGVRVRVVGPGIRLKPAPAPQSRDDGTVCFDRDVLERELAAFAERNAGRLTGVARAGEDLAAAYRACRAFTLNE